MEKPALYVVATPIGNMKDITIRALDVLREVDCIISEDTRVTAKILNANDIQKHQISYRDQNSYRVVPQILQRLKAGEALALTSDSGTPLISDPGFKLIQAVSEANYPIFTIPGPSAVVASLSVSGLPTDKFSFVGFLPKKGGDRTSIISDFGKLDTTLVIYESPYRVIKTLEDIRDILGDRYVCVAKELTKIHETLFRGTITDVLSVLQNANTKGEFVILVAKNGFQSRI